MRLLRSGLIGLCALGVLAGPASPQTKAYDDPEATVVKDIVVVAYGGGPAWWKVSKGDAVAWILALPPALAPKDLAWNKRMLERRLKDARGLYLPPEGKSQLDGRWTRALPAWTQAHIALAAVKAEFEPQPYIEPPTLNKVLELRGAFLRKARLGFDPENDIRAAARRLKVRVYQSPGVSVHLTPAQFDNSDPEVAACLTAMLEEIETDTEVFEEMGEHWAQGRPAEALAGPRGSLPVCMNRMLPGYSRRLIEAQTAEISAALQTPGHIVAVVPMRQLLAEEGVLQRLRAEGFTIADPLKPLDE